MKNKQSHFLKGSFALLLFMILGYVVKFYPENLVGIDQPIQSAIRGDLPAYLTAFFTRVTVLMNTPIVASWVGVIVLFFVWKKWYTEALLLTGSLVTTGLLVVILKHIYLRSRPALQHLVQEGGYSFPSGHSLAATLVFGSLIIVVGQRMTSQVGKVLAQIALFLCMVTIVVSRVYVGVHYPTDVTGSMLLGFGLLQMVFPYYDRLRFEWRFKSKQK
ncbi:phosphatase PAP2 family protein [Streptococcus australis]|uniref:phosphatase PAP2 family protein n=1 Tax=Streptococcus australis TaxID=113107 RepID=UPI0039C20311